MQLLLRRSQRRTRILSRPVFKLHARIEFEADEEEIIRHYGFQSARLIEVSQPNLVRQSVLVGFIVAAIVFGVFAGMDWELAVPLGIVSGIVSGWLYFDRNRETIFVKDLIHGRFFDCGSIIDLVRREAWLGIVTSFFRQVMESAKHWDGTEAMPIEALSKQEAKFVVIRGL